MSRILESERGMTLPEMLIAMTLMLIVLGATLTTLDSSGSNRRLNDQRNDTVEVARASIDGMVRQMRNLASPSAATPSAIDKASSYDFAFRTFDPNKKLVRYCLNTTNQTLYVMTMTGSATPDYTTCTATTSTWSNIKAAAQNVVNLRSSTPIFNFNGSTSNTPTITNVRVLVRIDINAAGVAPRATQLSSGSALRNQNQAPTASFTITPGSTRTYTLNGTGSTDPENRTLIYTWYAGIGATFTPDAAHQVAVGAVVTYTFPSTTPPGSYYFKLIVSDSNLTDMCPTSAGSATNCSTAGPKVL